MATGWRYTSLFDPLAWPVLEKYGSYYQVMIRDLARDRVHAYWYKQRLTSYGVKFITTKRFMNCDRNKYRTFTGPAHWLK